MQEPPQKEKKEPRRLFEILTIIVAVLVAGTTLWSNREKVPELWFNSTLIVLVVIVAVMMLDRTSSFWLNRLSEWREEGKRNKIAGEYFPEFRDLVDSFGSVSYSLFRVLDDLRGHFNQKLKEKMGLLPIYLVQVHNKSDVESPLYYLKERFNESNETFRDLALLVSQFAIILGILEKNLEFISTFAREIKKEHTIPNNIEIEYEEFRDKYNNLLRDFKKYCHRINREIGEDKFPEFVAHSAKKW